MKYNLVLCFYLIILNYDASVFGSGGPKKKSKNVIKKFKKLMVSSLLDRNKHSKLSKVKISGR